MESPGPAFVVSKRIVAGCVVRIVEGTEAAPATRFAASTSIEALTMVLFASPLATPDDSPTVLFVSSTSRGKSAPL